MHRKATKNKLGTSEVDQNNKNITVELIWLNAAGHKTECSLNQKKKTERSTQIVKSSLVAYVKRKE